MNKSDSAQPAGNDICIQQGDWEAYRNHIESRSVPGEQQKAALSDDSEDERGALASGEAIDAIAHIEGNGSISRMAHMDSIDGADSAGQPLNSEGDILRFRRECARAYIGMNGRLGGRAYRANAPVILTADAVQELAELNRLLREERAQKKKSG